MAIHTVNTLKPVTCHLSPKFPLTPNPPFAKLALITTYVE